MDSPPIKSMQLKRRNSEPLIMNPQHKERRNSEPLPIANQHGKITQNCFSPNVLQTQEMNQIPTTPPVYHSPAQQQLLTGAHKASRVVHTVVRAPQPAVAPPKNDNITPLAILNILETLVQASNKSPQVLPFVIAFFAMGITGTFALPSLIISPLSFVTIAIVTVFVISMLLFRVAYVNMYKNTNLFEYSFIQNKSQLQDFSRSNHVLATAMQDFISLCEHNVILPPSFFQSLFSETRDSSFFIFYMKTKLESIEYRAQQINKYHESQSDDNKNLFLNDLITKLIFDSGNALSMKQSMSKEYKISLIYRDCQLLQNILQMRKDNTPIFEKICEQMEPPQLKILKDIEKLFLQLNLNADNSVKFYSYPNNN